MAHPNPGDATVVVGLDHSGGGQIHIDVGYKSNSEDPLPDAGLSGGSLYRIKLTGCPTESSATGNELVCFAPTAALPSSGFTFTET